MNKITSLDLEDLIFDRVEKFQSIAEYEFYLVNLIGITKEGKKEEIFVKLIKKGKVKESLFCICDLAYEKYFDDKDYSIDELKKSKKVTILQEKQNSSYTNRVFVNLFEDNLKQEKVSIEINFIDISKLIAQIPNKKFKKKGLGKCIEISPKDIIIVGVKNKH